MKAHMRAVTAIAGEHGLIVRKPRRGGHAHVVDPVSGRLVAVVSTTPRVGDRALQQLRRDLRRRLAVDLEEVLR